MIPDAVTPEDWCNLLGSVPQRAHRLRPGIAHARLERLEARLGHRLPAAYRSFLQVADGGWIGDCYVYGSAGLLQLTEGLARRGTRARVLPFHPVDRQSVECLDLLDGRVLWCRDERPVRSSAWSVSQESSRLHPIAVAAFERHDLALLPTYEDFLDWALDSAMAAHREAQRGLIAASN